MKKITLGHDYLGTLYPHSATTITAESAESGIILFRSTTKFELVRISKNKLDYFGKMSTRSDMENLEDVADSEEYKKFAPNILGLKDDLAKAERSKEIEVANLKKQVGELTEDLMTVLKCGNTRCKNCLVNQEMKSKYKVQ